MKRLNKTRAFLTEFLIVILFFSIAAVITIQLFANTSKKSKENEDLINAVICAQTVAENIRSQATTYNSEGIYTKYIDKNLIYTESDALYEEKIIVKINAEASSDIGTMYDYDIMILDLETNEEIYTMKMSKYVSREVE